MSDERREVITFLQRRAQLLREQSDRDEAAGLSALATRHRDQSELVHHYARYIADEGHVAENRLNEVIEARLSGAVGIPTVGASE